MSGPSRSGEDGSGHGATDGGREFAVDRRTLLRGGAAVAGAALTSGCLGTTDLFSAVRGFASASPGAETRTSLDPDKLTAEPMRTTVTKVDDTAVLYQYGRPVPSFDTWSGNANTRDHRSLDGAWRFRFDPKNEGIRKQWHIPETDVSDWQFVSVPLPWDLYDTPGFASYDGSDYGVGTAFEDGYAWYRRTFDADESWGDSVVRLNFLGVNYMAWVFVDGTLVGQHEGGNTPFSLDVSDHVDPGSNHVLAVRVYRAPWWESEAAKDPSPVTHVTDIPSGPVDYWPYAGITRSVYLEVTPQVTVSKILTNARDGRLEIRAVVENHTQKLIRRDVTADPGIGSGGLPATKTVRIGPGGVRVVGFDRRIPNVEPWSPGNPKTYRAAITIPSAADSSLTGDRGDHLSTVYGMRTVGTDGSQLTIDGRPLFLKGVNWHEETAKHGRSLVPAEYDEILERVDDLDGNFVRNCHYNRHPYVYEATDERGILVLDEAANMWLDAAEQREQVRRYGLSRALVAAMAWNQHNHPSVGLWSLQNECNPFNSSYSDWIADMKAAVQAIDLQGRPITWAAKTPLDPEFGKADVIGLNEYYGYFGGDNSQLGQVLNSLHQLHSDTPILITENGSWSVPALRGKSHTDPKKPGTPDWQAAQFRAHWRQVVAPARRSYMAGYTFWNLKDYKERDDYNRFSFNGISTMGLLSFGGNQSDAAYRAFRDAKPPRHR